MRKVAVLVALASFLTDRVTKLLAQEILKHKSISLIPGILSLNYAENYGAAFSILSSGNPLIRKLFLIILPAVITLAIGIAILFGRLKNKIEAISFGLIFGGALGNLFDRILYGKVVDFIDFHYKNWHYPTFNVADIAVSIGCLAFIISTLKQDKS